MEEVAEHNTASHDEFLSDQTEEEFNVIHVLNCLKCWALVVRPCLPELYFLSTTLNQCNGEVKCIRSANINTSTYLFGFRHLTFRICIIFI